MAATQKKATPSFLQEIWSVLVSVKLTVIVMLLLALSSIIGTLIPQNKSLFLYQREYGEFWFRIFRQLDFFDMYHALWFQFFLLLLILNIIACSIDRLTAVWTIIFPKKINFNQARFKKSSIKATFTVDRSTNGLKGTFTHMIAKHFRHTSVEESGNGFVLFAEKGRWTRLGVYFVHLSVILLALGAIIGNLLGFDGFVTIGEGETVDSVHLNNAAQRQPLDFEIRCDRFNVTFYDDSMDRMPKEYRSSLTILKKGQPVYTKEIIVNDPLRFEGINIYQASYGQLPPAGAELSFSSPASGLVYSKQLKPGESFDIPENLGHFTLKRIDESHNFGNRDIGMCAIGSLKRDDQKTLEIVLPLQFPTFDKMRKGKVVIAIKKFTPRYYTGLQVTKDPGVPLVYTGFIIIILGCYITFFMSHDRICIEANETKGRSHVSLTAITNRNTLSLQTKVQKLAQKLASTKM